MDNRYTITEAASILNVHAHTLRYWEEELQLKIPRNELGHRVYYDEQVELFRCIKDLKEQGYQLNAIRMQVSSGRGEELRQSSLEQISAAKSEKMEKFQEMMNLIVKAAIIENREEIGRQITSNIIKEMNYLAREYDEQQEMRYKKLDEAIRQHGKSKFKKAIKKKSMWGQKEIAKKLKEELTNNKKEAIAGCDRI